MLLVKLIYDATAEAWVSTLKAADVKICFDLHMPCYALIVGTTIEGTEYPDSIGLINTFEESTVYAGSIEMTINDDGYLAIASGLS